MNDGRAGRKRGGPVEAEPAAGWAARRRSDGSPGRKPKARLEKHTSGLAQLVLRFTSSLVCGEVSPPAEEPLCHHMLPTCTQTGIAVKCVKAANWKRREKKKKEKVSHVTNRNR